MRRIAWATDVHLNFLQPHGVVRFCQQLTEPVPDAVLLTGDIAEAHNLERLLLELERRIARPIYFVLGNHDFYHGSIAEVRAMAIELTRRSACLRWLPAAGRVELTPHTALIGHDGWGDGRAGDYVRSDVLLNDYFLIRELAGLDAWTRLERLKALGDEAAGHVREMLPEALERHRHVIIATHVPPFEASCWHEGRISDDNWLPHFTCVAMGQALADIARSRPDRTFTVFCGHTHGSGFTRILPNLEVYTGGATYGAPELQRMIDVV